MYYSGINKMDIANGEGIRVSLFVSGCTNCCKGCFNKETWDFNYGNPFTEKTINEIMEYLKPSYIKGFSLLGGDPFELQNQKDCCNLVSLIKEKYPEKDIWCWSGYTLDDFKKEGKRYTEYTDKFLSNIDILIEGKFDLDKKDLKLKFRGSSNQQILRNINGNYVNITSYF